MIPQPHQLPPCMQHILHDLVDGKNVPHAARFSFAAFCLTAGVEREVVERQFKNTPNYSSDKTAKIVGGMVDRGYSPPNCARMAAEGCCTEAMKIPLCHSIANPISFFRARTGERQENRQWQTSSDSLGAAEPLVLAKCPCGWQSKPLPLSAQGAVGRGHYWQQPEADEANHMVEYLDLDGRPVVA